MADSWILDELLIFKDAFLLGVAMVIVYDCLRLFRRILPHGIIWISVEDFLYWLVSGIMIFLLLYYRNDGAMRLYILLGIACGALIYYFTLGRILFRLLSDNIQKMKKRLKKVYKAFTIWFVNRFRKRGDL